MIVGAGGNSNQAWAEVIEGTEGPDRIVGTPLDDIIDSKGGQDSNFGDTVVGDGSGNDVIDSGEGSDVNTGDTGSGQGSGNDVIISGDDDASKAEGDIRAAAERAAADRRARQHKCR